MRIDIVCRGVKPNAITVELNLCNFKIQAKKDRIIIESDENINRIIIKAKSFFSSKLCYLNIVNPIYYIYQFKLKNSDIYVYDNDFFWADIILMDVPDAPLVLNLTRDEKQRNGMTIYNYSVISSSHKKQTTISYHNMPQKEIFRFKLINIASNIIWPALICALGLWQLTINQENTFLYLSGIAILLLFSVIKIFKYCSSKSQKQLSHIKNDFEW